MAECPYCRSPLPARPILRDAFYNFWVSTVFGPAVTSMMYRDTTPCPICHLELKLETFRSHMLGLLAGLGAAVWAASAAVVRLGLGLFPATVVAMAVFFAVYSMVYLRLVRARLKTPRP